LTGVIPDEIIDERKDYKACLMEKHA